MKLILFVLAVLGYAVCLFLFLLPSTNSFNTLGVCIAMMICGFIALLLSLGKKIRALITSLAFAFAVFCAVCAWNHNNIFFEKIKNLEVKDHIP